MNKYPEYEPETNKKEKEKIYCDACYKDITNENTYSRHGKIFCIECLKKVRGEKWNG